MPKIKTVKSAAKRFRLTKKGKVVRQNAYASHIMTKKSSKRKRSLRQGGLVHTTEARSIKRMLGIG